MNTESTETGAGLEGIQPGRLFTGSCFALIATSVTFAMLGAIMGPLKLEFKLTNAEVGAIGMAGLLGFPISIFIFGPLCDVLGMKFLLRLAFFCHSLGVLLMVIAGASLGYWFLFFGALIIAMGNGLVEAVCNPLVTTLFPNRKTEKLNQFHVWFPGGIVIGGLLSFALSEAQIGSWQLKLGLILVPTVIYGFLFLGQRFPATERHQAGITGGEMWAATFGRPLFVLLLFCMMMTASLELGPNRWIPSVLKDAAVPGILILVWISLIMAVLRYYAGAVVERLSPTGILFCSAIVGGLGLLWLSSAETKFVALASSAVFAVGVCYFWPTMLGVTAERVPKGGALALAMVGGIGTACAGASNWAIGTVADTKVHRELVSSAHLQETITCFQDIVARYPKVEELFQAEGLPSEDVAGAIAQTKSVLEFYAKENGLPEDKTANTLRAAIGAMPDGSGLAARVEKAKGSVGYEALLSKSTSFSEGKTHDDKITALNALSALSAGPDIEKTSPRLSAFASGLAARYTAESILGPVDTAGGRHAFRKTAVLGGILAVIFGLLYANDRRRGGYKVEKIGGEG